MPGLSLARTNRYEDAAELARAIGRFKAQGYRERQTLQNPMPGEYVVGEKIDPWGKPVATIQWRAFGAPLPFRPEPEYTRATSREIATPRQREGLILAELESGPRTRGDLLFALCRVASEGTLEDALQSLLERGEVSVRVERYGRHRFSLAESAGAA